MTKVKIFLSVETEYTDMEHEINTWIATTKPKILSIQGNIAPQTPTAGGVIKDGFGASDLFVIVLYETE